MTQRNRAVTSSSRSEGAGIWPLDLALVMLGALVSILVVRLLRFDDPRPLHNAWTYLLGIPTAFIATSMLARVLVSERMEKSIQIGFLISTALHLVLTFVAINTVLFTGAWPEAFEKVELIARSQSQAAQFVEIPSSPTETQPDYLRPVVAELSQPTNPTIAQGASADAPFDSSMSELPSSLAPGSNAIERQRAIPTLNEPSVVSEVKMPDRSSVPRSEAPKGRRIELPELAQGQTPNLGNGTPENKFDVRRVGEVREAELATSRGEELQREELQPTVAPLPKLEANSLSESKVTADLDKTFEQNTAVDASLPIRPTADANMVQFSPTRIDVPENAAKTSANPDSVPVPSMLSERADRELIRQSTSGDVPPLSSMTTSNSSITGMAAPDLDARIRPNPTARNVVPLPDRSSASNSVAGGLESDPKFADASILPRRSAGSNVRGGVSGQVVVPSDSPPPDVAQGAEGSLRESTAMANPATRSDSASDAAILDPTRASGRVGLPGQSPRRDSSPLIDAPRNSSAIADMGSTNFGPGIGTKATPMLGASKSPIGSGSKGIGEPEITSPELQLDRFRRSNQGAVAKQNAQVPIPSPAFKQRMRRNEEASSEDLKAMGPLGPQTEDAIERGLEFLSNFQRSDGSWRLEDFDTKPLIRSNTAATALALLAFQGAGYSHEQYKYQANCKKALDWLRSVQKKNGDLYQTQDDASDKNGWLYSHAIATLALCEAYGMTRDEALRDPAQRAVDFLVYSQDPLAGGWRYTPRVGSDTSVTGWGMMALKSAELSGLNVPKETYAGISRWLNSSEASARERYLYRYNWQANTPQTQHGRIPTPVMTSVGLLMRLYLGWRRSNPDMVRGADWLLERKPSLGTIENPKRDTYYWYYSTQVLFHMGADRWRAWYSTLYPILIESQVAEGQYAGSWDPQGEIPDAWGEYAGRLYVTTMNLLSLEVTYRHLPIYDATGL